MRILLEEDFHADLPAADLDRRRARRPLGLCPSRDDQRSHLDARPHSTQSLLKAGDGWRDAEIMAAFAVSRETVSRVRARFAAGGVAGGLPLTGKRQTHRRRALSDAQATHLLALAFTTAPAGHDHWTLRLLAGKAVELGFVERISPETIRALRKKTRAAKPA